MQTVRARTALVASIVVAIAFLFLSVFLVGQLRSNLLAEIDRSNDARAADLAAANEDEINELGVSIDGSSVAAFLLTEDGQSYDVIATDPNLTSDQVLDAFADVDTPASVTWPNLTETTGSENMRGVLQDLPLFDTETGETYIVGDFVIVASSLDGVDRSVANLRRNLLIVGPLLVLMVAALVWWLTGRALRPMEDIRLEAASIGGSALHQRVPESGVDDEVGRLAITFNSMLDRLEASQSAQRQFVADASHELRSPLASIAAQLDVDAAHPETADHHATAEVVGQHTRRMQAMIEDLLLLARADDGSLAPETSLLDLDDLVTEVAHTIVVRDGISVDLSSVSPGSIRGHDGQIRRLVTNLATNAVRHAHTTVAIGLSTEGEHVELTIDDDGDGIAPDEYALVFERFVRLDEARARDGGGSGLGLAISTEIAQAHEASIDVGRAPLGGARFSVRFPAAKT